MPKLFEKGDRVLVTDPNYLGGDKKATVVMYSLDQTYLVELDIPHMGAHSGGGRTREKHGWWVMPHEIHHLSETSFQSSLRSYIGKELG